VQGWNVSRLRRDVESELDRVRAVRRRVEGDRIGRAGYAALILAVVLNLLGFLYYFWGYMLMWVVASLYFYMFYPLLPLIPALLTPLLNRREGSGYPVPDGVDIGELVREFRELRLGRFKKRVVQVLWNVFFLGAVPLTGGFLLIFSIDVLFAVYANLVFRALPDLTVLFVILQSMAIMAYYTQIYLLEPYSHQFSHRVLGPIRNRRGLSLVLIGLVVGIAAFVVVVMTVMALLFPGYTVGMVLPLRELIEVRFNLFLLVLLASQFIFMQALHRRFSRSLALALCTAGERALVRESRALRRLARKGTRCRLRRYNRALSVITEARLYRVEPHRFFGLFTVFLLAPDLLSLLSLRYLRRLDLRIPLQGRHAAGRSMGEPSDTNGFYR
jgi:hypothetical protein